MYVLLFQYFMVVHLTQISEAKMDQIVKIKKYIHIIEIPYIY